MAKEPFVDVIEKSTLYLSLSENLLIKLDRFLCNTNLTKKEQENIIKIIEEIYSEAYVNSLTD